MNYLVYVVELIIFYLNYIINFFYCRRKEIRLHEVPQMVHIWNSNKLWGRCAIPWDECAIKALKNLLDIYANHWKQMYKHIKLQ